MTVQVGNMPIDVAAELRAILKKEASNLADVPDDAKLTELGLDSLAIIETIFAIEDKFRIQVQPSNDQVAAMTFRDLCDFVEVQLGRANGGAGLSRS